MNCFTSTSLGVGGDVPLFLVLKPHTFSKKNVSLLHSLYKSMLLLAVSSLYQL